MTKAAIQVSDAPRLCHLFSALCIMFEYFIQFLSGSERDQ